MKTSLNVLLLTCWLTIFLFVVCGFATAECNIAVVANKPAGDKSNFVNNIAFELSEEFDNTYVVRVGSLQDMKTKVLSKLSELNCGCIETLYIVDHGHPGVMGVGNGEKGTDNTKRITRYNKTNWSDPLGSLGMKLCEASGVWLFGCNVGYCYNAVAMLYEVAKHMKTMVFAPVDMVFAKKKGDHITNVFGLRNYLENTDSRNLIAFSTSTTPPWHSDKIAEVKAKEKTTTARTEFNCPCNGASYAGLQDCHNGCQTSLSCFTGICDPIWVNDTCDKFGGNPILTGGTATTATPSALLKTSHDQKRVSSNLGSVNERQAQKSASKSNRAALAGWDDYGLSQPTILKDGALYRMWFAGYDSSNIRRIGYAISADGADWLKYSGNPVLQPGAAGSWDETYVYNPTVIKDGSTFKMWFSGYSVTTDCARIGYATSTDGMTWTKHPTYVLDRGASGAWDEISVGECCVIKEGDTYKMWFAGKNHDEWWQIGYATSTDGIVWTKYSGNPVLSWGGEGEWDYWMIGCPAVIKGGGVYHMLYGGTDFDDGTRIGYATSSKRKDLDKIDSEPIDYRRSGQRLGQWLGVSPYLL